MKLDAFTHTVRRQVCSWLFSALCGATLLISHPAAGMAPPINEQFNGTTLPSDLLWLYESSTEGRIALKGDDSDLVSNDIPGGTASINNGYGGNRMRGNYYRCDTTAGLHRQSIYLGRSQPTSVRFCVYESTTENGTYNLIASNTVTASAGTNMLYSGSMDTTLQAGRYYLIGASWNKACAYRWAGSHPVATSFGTSLKGYENNVYPPPTSTSGFNNTLVYVQTLEIATNMVMRMDDSINGGLVSTNSLGLVLNLENYTDVTLSFRHRSGGDELDAADGIYLSVDGGSSFYKIHSLDPASTAWTSVTLDIDALAAANGLTLGGSSVIKFQQSDNFGWPTDGREFDDIKIYSRPDIVLDTLTSSVAATNTWKGFSSGHYIPLSVGTTSRSGAATENYPTLRFRYALEQSGSIQYYDDDIRSWNFPALETATLAWNKSFYLPAGVHFPNNLYTVSAMADSSGVVSEALEINNKKDVPLLVNHYSGKLWFDNFETDITISSWTRTSDKDHRITGTGTLEGFGFSFNNLHVVKNLTTLDYSLHSTETKTIPVTVPNRRQIGNVYYWFPSGINLSRLGGYADMKVRLPAGLGIDSSESYMMQSSIYLNSIKLKPGLYPNAAAITKSGPFCISEETKPLIYTVQDITWTPLTGRFEFAGDTVLFTRSAGLDRLEQLAGNGFLKDPAMAEKRSNAQYYRFADSMLSDVVVNTASGKDARLSTSVLLSQGQFKPHFPYGPQQLWHSDSPLEMKDDLILISSTLNNPDDLLLQYARTCPTNACASHAGPAPIGLTAASDAMFSKDGGFRQLVALSDIDVQWGMSITDVFAQEAFNFTEGTYYMPGHFLRGDQSQLPLAANLGPGVILFSGALPASEMMERPGHYSGTENYRNGLADYAGLNLRCGSDADHAARCSLGGTPTDPWPLTGRSKYYLRLSGVSGIHEAVFKSFPDTLEIYGYLHNFSNYGLSFLSGEPEESRINGYVSIPYPSSFDIEYTEMMLDCMGEILRADVSAAPDKQLAYWNAVINPGTLFYAPMAGNTCGNSKRALCLGITTACANIDKPMSGILGFLPNGEIAAEEDGVQNVDSRLSLPNLIDLDGPAAELYHFAPILSAYYNDYGESGDGFGDIGWINFAGALDVAFFEDLNVLFHTSASTNSSSAPIHMTGGFTDTAGYTFYGNAEEFDPANAGFPNTFPSTITVEEFRKPSTDTYRAIAEKSWLDVIDFRYPLDWSSASKSFKSPNAVKADFMVINVEHQTDYLSAENAELSFGIQYDGLPQINLANMAFNAINESTGMAQAFTEGVGEELFGTITGGMDRFDKLLADVPEKLFDPLLDETIDPIVDTLYNQLHGAYLSAPGTDYYSNLISNYVGGVGAVHSAQDAFDHLVDGFGNTTNLLGDIDQSLELVLRTIDAFTSVVNYDPLTGDQLAQPINGLLNLQGTHFEVLGDLASSILGHLAANLANSLAAELQSSLDDTFAQLKPALDTATEYLLEVRGIITNAQAQLTLVGSFGNELQSALDPGQIAALVTAAADDIIEQFRLMDTAGNLFDEYTQEEIKTIIRQAIEDRFYASLACCNMQQIIRSRLYDVQASLNTAIDGVFQQVNQALRNVVSEYISAIDEEINGMLGSLSDVIGSGQIDGYAHIKDDSLTELRLDGAFQWKVPDEMEFKAYLIIKQLNSDGSASCGLPGGNATEVTLGTDDVGLSWVGSDLRAKINTKFAFATSPGEVIGLAGAFEMTEGEIGFESFAMTELYAAVAFGQYENYLSAAVRCELTSFEVEGGVFFGRTCSLDPFAWDPDVQGILGDPPFTGIYVYGEGWIPIIDYGCLFRVKAGVGAGMFAFLEGPIGGKIFLGVEGEAICVVGVRGEITLVGLKNGDVMRMKGKGKISGKVGPCPFCIKFKKTAEMTYENGDWDVDY